MRFHSSPIPPDEYYSFGTLFRDFLTRVFHSWASATRYFLRGACPTRWIGRMRGRLHAPKRVVPSEITEAETGQRLPVSSQIV